MKLVRKTGRSIIVMFICSVAAVLVNTAHADSFGRFFTTPEQRAVLDKMRHHPHHKRAGKKPTKSVAVAKKGLEINGVVVRGDGKNTVWVNGKSNFKTNFPEAGVEIVSRNIKSDSVTITLSNLNKRVALKPGQILDPVTGKISDSYKIKK
jgi:hypothetical protein